MVSDKEEYKKLLQSDYWKGYSYSLIKERDFTCEDCGRRFYNERNKLQVHHLVYRDVYPWSYNPDEVIVLCEDCHKKRHGVFTESDQTVSYTQTPLGEYNKDYSSSTGRSATNPYSSQDFGPTEDASRLPYPIEPEPRRFKFKYILYGLLLLLFVMIGRDIFTKQEPLSGNRPSYKSMEHPTGENETAIEVQASEKNTDASVSRKAQRVLSPVANSPSVTSDEVDLPMAKDERTATIVPKQKKRTESAHNETADKEDIGRELSTLEILERRNHTDVVKRAQRAGVSTEGTTIEILERINHADVVKRAQRAGVSTEGSTIDILERINHADVVKRAKRIGVGTEGSTIDILERINRKEMEKYNR